MGKKYFFPYFFSCNLPTDTHLQFKKWIFLLKFCVKIIFCRHYISPLNTFMRKGKDSEPDPDPYLWQWIRIREAHKHADPTNPDPDPQHWLKRYYTSCSAIMQLFNIRITIMNRCFRDIHKCPLLGTSDKNCTGYLHHWKCVEFSMFLFSEAVHSPLAVGLGFPDWVFREIGSWQRRDWISLAV